MAQQYQTRERLGFMPPASSHRRPRDPTSKLAPWKSSLLAFLGLQYVPVVVYIYRRFVKNTTMPRSPRRRNHVKLVKKAGISGLEDLHAHGIPRLYLGLAVEQGAITRVGRGLYIARGAKPTEHHSLAQASKRVPKGVVCLLSALRFHDLTTQCTVRGMACNQRKSTPPQARQSTASHCPLLTKDTDLRSSRTLYRRRRGSSLLPIKTVADCFRYRNEDWTRRCT